MPLVSPCISFSQKKRTRGTCCRWPWVVLSSLNWPSSWQKFNKRKTCRKNISGTCFQLLQCWIGRALTQWESEIVTAESCKPVTRLGQRQLTSIMQDGCQENWRQGQNNGTNRWKDEYQIIVQYLQLPYYNCCFLFGGLIPYSFFFIHLHILFICLVFYI